MKNLRKSSNLPLFFPPPYSVRRYIRDFETFFPFLIALLTLRKWTKKQKFCFFCFWVHKSFVGKFTIYQNIFLTGTRHSKSRFSWNLSLCLQGENYVLSFCTAKICFTKGIEKNVKNVKTEKFSWLVGGKMSPKLDDEFYSIIYGSRNLRLLMLQYM